MVCKAKQQDFIDNILDLEFEEDLEEAKNLAISDAREKAKREMEAKARRRLGNEETDGKFSFIYPKDKLGKIGYKPLKPNKGKKIKDFTFDIDNNLPNEEDIEKLQETGEGQVRAIGKLSVFVDENNFAGVEQRVAEKFDLETSYTVDPIRYFAGRSYFLESSYKLKNNLNKKNNALIKNLTLNSIDDDQENPSNYGRNIEKYYFNLNKDLIVNSDSKIVPDLIKKLIDGGTHQGTLRYENKDSFKFPGLYKKNVIIDEMSFEMQKPYPYSEKMNTETLYGASIVKTKAEYNFYIKDYEKIANKNEKDEYGRVSIIAKENYLPNLYVLSLVSEAENINSSNVKRYLNPFLKNYVYLNNFINTVKNPTLNKTTLMKGSITSRKAFSNNFNSSANKLSNAGEYFDAYASAYKNFISLSKVKDDILNRSKNILVRTDFVSNISTYNQKKYLFPMCNTVTIPMDKKTNIARVLKDTNLMDDFIVNFVQKNINNTNNIKSFYNSTEYNDIKLDNPAGNAKSSKKYAFQKTPLNVYDVGDILIDLKSSTQEPRNFLTLGRLKERKTSKFLRSLNTLIFQGKLQTFIRDNFRNFNDIYNGKKAYNETIFYRLEKKDGNTGEVLQNYWIPNDPSAETLDIIDTQIKYDKTYTYSLYAYQFVIGTSYWYDNVSHFAKNILRCRIISEPNLSIVEIPLLSDTVIVKDDFPLPPDITFIPYQNTDNVVGICFNNSSGLHKEKPIILTENDKLIINSTDLDVDGKVTYKNDDVPKRFEIFRLENKPFSYDDFKEALITKVDTDINPVKNTLAPSAMYNDRIMPNKKYYYIFRTIDVHNNFSNPTSVYEVEILNEKGMIYPIFKQVNFETLKNINTLEASRFLYIAPKSIHRLINQEKSNLQNVKTANEANENIVLGNSDVSIPWGKTFKMVLTSKQTGKKMEIRFKFDHKSVQSK